MILQSPYSHGIDHLGGGEDKQSLKAVKQIEEIVTNGMEKEGTTLALVITKSLY